MKAASEKLVLKSSVCKKLIVATPSTVSGQVDRVYNAADFHGYMPSPSIC